MAWQTGNGKLQVFGGSILDVILYLNPSDPDELYCEFSKVLFQLLSLLESCRCQGLFGPSLFRVSSISCSMSISSSMFLLLSPCSCPFENLSFEVEVDIREQRGVFTSGSERNATAVLPVLLVFTPNSAIIAAGLCSQRR